MNIKKLLGESYKEDLTTQELIELLEKVEEPKDNSLELSKLKSAMDKASSEAADYKKKYKSLVDEQTLQNEEKEESIKAMQEELASAKKQLSVIENAKQMLALGYSDEQATKAANALAEGKLTEVFKIQKEVMDGKIKAVQEQGLKAMKEPLAQGSEAVTSITPEQFNKMGYSERTELFKNDPDTYAKLTNNGGN